MSLTVRRGTTNVMGLGDNIDPSETPTGPGSIHKLLQYMAAHWTVFDGEDNDGIAVKADFETVFKDPNAAPIAKEAARRILYDDYFDGFIENGNAIIPGDRTISYAEVTDALAEMDAAEPDGVVDPTSQGQYGDCGSLATINSLANTAAGRAILKNMIKGNPEGGYDVEFLGVKGKTFHVSQDDIDRWVGAVGDADVRILEIAANNYYKEQGFPMGVEGAGIDSLYRVFTGIPGGGIAISLAPYNQSDRLDRMAMTDSALITAGFGVADHDKGIWTAHAYTVTKIDKDKHTITFHNPWFADTSKDFTFTYDEAAKYQCGVNFLELDETKRMANEPQEKTEAVLDKIRYEYGDMQSFILKSIEAIRQHEPYATRLKNSISAMPDDSGWMVNFPGGNHIPIQVTKKDINSLVLATADYKIEELDEEARILLIAATEYLAKQNITGDNIAQELSQLFGLSESQVPDPEPVKG